MNYQLRPFYHRPSQTQIVSPKIIHNVHNRSFCGWVRLIIFAHLGLDSVRF